MELFQLNCLIECNMPPLNALLAQKQYNFLQSALEKRINMEDEDPFMFVWSLLKRYHMPLSQKVDSILKTEQKAYYTAD